MALRQSRRSVSMNRGVYNALMAEARKHKVTGAEIIERGLRALGLEVPATRHVPERIRKRAVKARAAAPVAPAAVLPHVPAPEPCTPTPPVITKRPSLERQMLGDHLAAKWGFE